MTESPGTNHAASLLRRLTHRSTLRALRSGGVLTVAQVARAAGLSRPTVVSQLDELLEQGWVEEQPPDPSGGMGRPARRFRFHSRAGYVVGVDIGAHTIRAAIADLSGDIITARRRAIDEQAGSAERLDLARDLIGQVVDEARCTHSHVLAICVGTPGIVDPLGRVTLSVLPDWTGIDLAGRISRSFPSQVIVDNDANLAAIGEHWRGAGREADNVVHVLAGRRTGAGLLINGRVHRGRTGAAGEIGALALLGWDTAPQELVHAAGPDADPNLAAQQIFADAQAGQPAAVAAVRRFAGRLAQGVAALVLAIDPDIVIIGGGMSMAGDTLLAPLAEDVNRLCLNSPVLRMSTLGDEAVVLGAIRLALDDVEQRLFSLDTLIGS